MWRENRVPRGFLAMAALSLLLSACGKDDEPTPPLNDPPSACFGVDPAAGTTDTLFSFDASCSGDPQDSARALQTRWDWEDDGSWDTEWSDEKTATHRYPTAGWKIVRLEVRDTGGLTDVGLDTLIVGTPNAAPAACFRVRPTQGSAETVFDFDAACSADAEDGADSLRVRWDWENDGTWDTEWSGEKAATHQFETLGRKIVKLEVRDTGGRTSTALESLEVVINYLGQSPPGMVPRLFPPAELRATSAWFWHGTPAFSPSGTEMFFTKYVRSTPQDYTEIVYLIRENGHWSGPHRAPFGNTDYFENNPWFSTTGDTLYYVSGRDGGFIFSVTRAPDGWSQPVPLPVPIPPGTRSGLQFSFSKRGTLYAELWEGSDLNIYRWEQTAGSFADAERLGDPINTPYFDFMPFIDPEERFLLFCSKRPGGHGMTDIYVSWRQKTGTWGEARNLGRMVNSGSEEGWPSISPDGRFFFFGSPRGIGSRGYEPFWVDVGFLRTEQGIAGPPGPASPSLPSRARPPVRSAGIARTD